MRHQFEQLQIPQHVKCMQHLLDRYTQVYDKLGDDQMSAKTEVQEAQSDKESFEKQLAGSTNKARTARDLKKVDIQCSQTTDKVEATGILCQFWESLKGSDILQNSGNSHTPRHEIPHKKNRTGVLSMPELL